MKIESECYQIMKDNVSDLCHWPALCNAGATMSSPHRQTECFLAVSHTRLQIAQTSFNTAPPSYSFTPPLQHHPYRQAPLRSVKQQAHSVLSASSHHDDSVETGVWAGRLLSAALCSERKSCKKGKILPSFTTFSSFLLMLLNIGTPSRASTAPVVSLVDYLCFY